MNDLDTIKELQAQSWKLYAIMLDMACTIPDDAEYTEALNALDKLRDDQIRFDNALYNMTAEWKEN